MRLQRNVLVPYDRNHRRHGCNLLNDAEKIDYCFCLEFFGKQSDGLVNRALQ